MRRSELAPGSDNADRTEESGTANAYASPLRDPILIVFIFAIIVIIALVLSPEAAHRFEVSDFPEYYAASALTLHGNGAGIYDPQVMCAEQQKIFPALAGRCVPLFCPPPGLIWLAPVSLIPAAVAIPVWTGLLSVVLTASMILLADFAQLSKRQTLYMAILVAISGPTYETLRTGQIAPILLLAIVLALRALKSNRQVISGVATSIFVLKPHLIAPFCAAMLGALRLRMLISLVAVASGLTGIALALIGTAGFSNFWHYLSGSMNQGGVNVGATFRAQLMRLVPGEPNIVNAVSVGVLVIGCAFLTWIGHRVRERQDSLERIACASLPLALTLSLHAFPYDLLLITPAIACWLKLQPLRNCPRSRQLPLIIIGAAALATFVMPLYLVLHYGMVLRGAVINPLFLSMVVVSALGLLAAVSRDGTANSSLVNL